jgi:hypothetical protein
MLRPYTEAVPLRLGLQLLVGNFWMALRYPGANRGVDLIQLSHEEMLCASDHY